MLAVVVAAAAAVRRARDAASLAFRSERARAASSVLARGTILPPLAVTARSRGMVVEVAVLVTAVRAVAFMLVVLVMVVLVVMVVVVAALAEVVMVVTVLVVVPAEGGRSIN